MNAHIFRAYGQQMGTQLKNDSPLGLGSVLVGSLPATLMTDNAPDRYTVEAVFTRQADRDEVAAIHDASTRDYLKSSGFPTVELRVSDRRLEIANTNLEELRDGLANVIADHLAAITLNLRAERELAALRFSEATELEQRRAAAVADLAESVTFSRPAHLPGHDALIAND
ncbi:hypothetical protein [Microbacterium sp. BLY]|uniref:hypothetical protein n=1 Tax=Microbacterium sp. BLY TaxID=2823280 RepID=UPI0027DD3356|nr:hypothetical protein [Microbacterium sp. BLY]